MKKIYAILASLMLAGLLVIGFYSLFHLSGDVKKPKLTFGSLFSGSYAEGRRSYYAEAFPQSESLKNMNTKLNGFYKFSGLSGKDDVQLIINMNTQAANGGASLATESSATSVSGSTANPTEPTESSEESSENVKPSDGVEPGTVVENLGAALLIGNRAVEVPYADYNSIKNYAGAVTNIASALGSKVRTFNIAVPNAAEFYTPEDYHTGSCSQIDMIDYCYDHLGDNVHGVDAYSKLAAHIDEYIYFRTDHHWTQLGAYYAYTAFCEEAGLTPQPLTNFEQGQYDRFVGSMYNFLSNYQQASILKEQPDVLHYYRPYVETETYYYADANLDLKYEIGVISYVGDNTSNKYLCFIGGDHPITIINTDVKDGPVCMLLKESYGNAFAPWLTSHYSKVIVIDPREFNRDGKPSLDLAKFAKDQGVNDCIVLNYPMMINSDAYIEWLNRLVGVSTP